MTDDEASRMLDLVRQGTPIRRLTAGAKPPFSLHKLRTYRARNPAWAADLMEAATTNALAALRARTEARSRALTHCVRGHELAGDNVGWKIARGSRKPGRFCRACSRLDAAKVRPMTTEKVAKVTRLIAVGVPLRRIYQKGQHYVTGFQNIKYQRAIDPAFDRLIVQARGTRLAAPDIIHDNTRLLTGFGADDYTNIRAMTPAHLPPYARDEIAQDVMVALIEGKIAPTALVQQLRQFVTKYNRDFPTNYAKFGSARMVSLDEAIYDDGGGSRYDMISEGLWT